MAVRNVARGGGKAYKPGVYGLKELEKQLKAILPDNPEMKADLYEAVGGQAMTLRDRMKANALAAGWASRRITTKKSGTVTGQDAIDCIFSSAKPVVVGNRRIRIYALAGVSKRRNMVEWIAGKFPKSAFAKVAPGNPVAEGFATMLEFGTSRMSALPALRTAIQAGKQGVIDGLTASFNSILVKYTQ